MLLAIDVGNTNTVFALVDPAALDGGERGPLAQWRTATEPQRTADEYAVWLSQIMTLGGRWSTADVTACIVSTVVPQALFNLRNLARRYLSCEPMIVGPDIPGVEVRIDRPSEAGADRLVGAVGGFVRYGGPLVVVDSGTATTFDVVGADGGFEGGVIAPGINLSVQALHGAAARLPRIEIRNPGAVVGQDTVHAMQSGIFWGYIELIDGLIRRIREEDERKFLAIGTGGVASLFQGASHGIDMFDPQLTINGLHEIWKLNSSEARSATNPNAHISAAQ